MSTREQAIQIEQLKDQRAKARDALFLEILSVSREIDKITNELFALGSKRKNLYEKLNELRKKQKHDEEHYDLLIRARQTLCEKESEKR